MFSRRIRQTWSSQAPRSAPTAQEKCGAVGQPNPYVSPKQTSGTGKEMRGALLRNE